MLKTIVGFLLFITLSSFANEDITSKVQWLSVYTEYGNGDVGFLTQEKGTICYGYWISGDAPGLNQAYSTLLSAYHSDSPVQLNVSPAESEKWPASSNHYCKVIRLALAKN
ncbi:MAG: hypothetical protein ACFHVJ_11630 [Aestuariibacter sp.]